MHRSNPTSSPLPLNRRQFLQGMGGAIGLALLQPAQTLAGADSQPLFRGTSDGKILRSTDDGQTWQTVCSFGDHLSIQILEQGAAGLTARLSLAGNHFYLISNDGITWRSQETLA